MSRKKVKEEPKWIHSGGVSTNRPGAGFFEEEPEQQEG